ncbi:MAG TPA: Flp family type IVb pilin [Vicinamibacterales bacterium]|nr:Flp family type IVb pilin [Vicinamibacterales bacterium]
MLQWFNRLLHDEEGQDLVEYAFLIVFIALVAVVGANQLGISLRNFYNTIGTTLTSIGPPTPPTPGS